MTSRANTAAAFVAVEGGATPWVTISVAVIAQAATRGTTDFLNVHLLSVSD